MRTILRTVVCGLPLVVMLAGAVHAQTQGMERRDERRDNRAAGRAAKQACKAGDEKTRAECRHQKRAVKHGTAPATGQPPAAEPQPAQ